MNLKEKIDFLAQGYINEYVEELYNKDSLRISLNSKNNKIWIEINDKKIENLKENQGEKIIKVSEFIEVLTKYDCSEGSKIDLNFRSKILEQLYEDLIP